MCRAGEDDVGLFTRARAQAKGIDDTFGQSNHFLEPDVITSGRHTLWNHQFANRAVMTERNRNFGAALGIVIVLIALATLAAALAP